MCTPCVAAARRCSGRGCSRRSMCSRSAPQQLHVRWLRTARRQPCLGTAHVEHVEHGHATWPLRAVQLQWQPPTRAHAPSLHQERARARAHVGAAQQGKPTPAAAAAPPRGGSTRQASPALRLRRSQLQAPQVAPRRQRCVCAPCGLPRASPATARRPGTRCPAVSEPPHSPATQRSQWGTAGSQPKQDVRRHGWQL